MRRVLHLIDAHTPPDMLRQLALLAGEGETAVSVGAPPAWPGRTLPVREVHRPMGSARLAGWRMAPLAETPDVLHAWSIDAMWAGREMSLATGRPLIASLPCAPRGRQVAALRSAVGPGLLSLTVPTHAARAELVAGRLPERCVHVLPAAAEAIDDRPTLRARVREALGLGEADRLIVVPDAMVRHAGHPLASWAHAIVRQVLDGLWLLFPGGGPAEKHVRFFANTTGYVAEALFTGDRFSQAEALAAADIAAVLHERPVGVGALAAAMAAGLPILASATADNAECTEGGAAAVLVEPGQPQSASAGLLRLLEEPDLSRRLAAAAGALAERRFAPAACRRRLAEIRAAATTAP